MFLTISGATGFIGRRLLALYPPDQHSLVVLARKNPRLDPLVHYGHWDPVAGEPSRELLQRSEAVIHLAGEPVSQRWTPAVKAAIRDSRVLGTRHLVSAIGKLRHRPKTLVCASAVGIYGHRGEEVLPESAPPASGFLPEVCTAWEAEADKAREYGLRVVKLRIGIVLGADGGALAAMAPLFRWGLGGVLGSGKQWMSWIHVDDLARMIQFAVENEAVSGVVNGVAPNPVTNAEFTRQLAGALHRPALLPAPEFGVKLLYGEMAQILFASQRVQPAAAQAAGFSFRYPELRPALDAIFG
ncbi:MAG: TIGR01777 family protein [Acidobacteriaceae bacterium]|nr:TIGR01777 family protein [Acidobacteriaceae bacterium]